jgi:hypothetical protein
MFTHNAALPTMLGANKTRLLVGSICCQVRIAGQSSGLDGQPAAPPAAAASSPSSRKEGFPLKSSHQKDEVEFEMAASLKEASLAPPPPAHHLFKLNTSKF